MTTVWIDAKFSGNDQCSLSSGLLDKLPGSWKLESIHKAHFRRICYIHQGLYVSAGDLGGGRCILALLFSIADFAAVVEALRQICGGLNLFLQLDFRPAVLGGSLQVLAALFHCQVGFQDDRILRPTNLHGLCHEVGALGVQLVKVPHPA